jgi:cell division protease FtsH
MSSLRLWLVCALAVLGALAPAAAADGGAAACSTPVSVDRAQQLGGLALDSDRYTVTILDSSELSCDEAAEEFRSLVRAPGAELPEGWEVDPASGTFQRTDGTRGFRVDADTTADSGGGVSWDSIQDWVIVWLPIIFMGLIAVVLIMTLRYMPRTKPQEIKPQSSSSVRWQDVAGVDEAKDELREVVEFLRDPKRFRRLGAKVPKGILLHGPPGTGKTLLAKAVANEAEARFFAQSASSFVEMFAGLGAARIRRLFRRARKEAPAIVFIDELDAVGATRGKDISGEKDQTLNQLLVELDGFESADNVVVIAASNLLDKLDPALLRPGRFDRQILVSAPDLKGRRAILDVHTRGMPLEPDLDLDLIARQTSNLTGADLANICNEAAIFAGRDHRDSIGTRDFQAALERVIAGMQSRRVITEHEKRVVAYHEAGHALCSELLPSVEKVHRISIIPRGRALGYTLNLPEEDRYLKTKEELIDYMSVLLGGRAAEEIVFGSITTGASDDLSRVAEISRSMVHDYAMGTSITSRKVSAEGGQVSDRTRQLRDEEQQHLADEALRGAMRLIVEHRTKLDQLAGALLRNEVLERRDIDRIMEGVPRFHRSPGQGLRVVAATRRNGH